MTDRNETPDAGGSPGANDIDWDEYEASVRTPEDVRNFEKWMAEEKAKRVQEIRRERFLLKLLKPGGGE